MKPHFSVIVPTYNRGYIIWKTIQSVQKQIYPFWELIIIDDGSTDNTAQVVAQFHKDPRILYFKTKNKGQSHARNFGMKKAKGEIITYLDSDDIFYENCLNTALEWFGKYPNIIFAIPNYNRRIELYDKSFKLLDFAESSSSQKLSITLQDIYHWNVKSAYGTGLFHRREVLNTNIHWDEKLRIFDDWDFALQLGKNYPKGFMHIPYVLYEYLQKYGLDGRCSNTTYGEWAQGFEAIYQKHKNDSFMKGQKWYPQRVEKYTKLQKMVDAGKEPSAVYKYFPSYSKK